MDASENGDQLPTAEPSGLVLATAVPVLIANRRIVAPLWFGALAFIAPCVLFGIAQNFAVGLMYAIGAGLAGLVSGALIGTAILDPSITKSAFGASMRGVAIVLLSHCILPITVWIETIFLGSPSPFTVSNLVLYAVISIALGGIITIPTGWLGAWILFSLRGWTTAPKGCSVHGYGQAIPATTHGANYIEAKDPKSTGE